MELKGSKTEQNLMTAFAGESQARNKYTYFASKAKKEGYEQIAAIFLETAENEKEHAKMWFKELNGGDIPTTALNLCMMSLLKLLKKKDSKQLLLNLEVLLLLKKLMKKDIENYLKMLRATWYLVKMETEFGFAVIVDIFVLVKKLQKFVQYVLIHKHILKLKLIITNKSLNINKKSLTEVLLEIFLFLKL